MDPGPLDPVEPIANFHALRLIIIAYKLFWGECPRSLRAKRVSIDRLLLDGYIGVTY